MLGRYMNDLLHQAQNSASQARKKFINIFSIVPSLRQVMGREENETRSPHFLGSLVQHVISRSDAPRLSLLFPGDAIHGRDACERRH